MNIIKKTMCVLLLLSFCLSGCAKADVPDEVRSFYLEFLETGKTDMERVANEYCFYENPDERAFAATSTDYLLTYTINEWEQITDRLWAVNVTITSEEYSSERQLTHFVGEMDGRYWIFKNASRVPEEICEYERIEKYMPTGEYVDFEDLISQ